MHYKRKSSGVDIKAIIAPNPETVIIPDSFPVFIP